LAASVLLAFACPAGAGAQERPPLPGSSVDFSAKADAAAQVAQATGAPADAPLRSEPSQAVASGRLRFCAGLQTGNYTFAAERIAEKARPLGLDLQVVPTPGAADNLRRLRAGECDIALSQSDIFELRRAEDPGGVRGVAPFARAYSEYVHVLCPVASGWTGTAQFGPGTRLITGAEGSGSSETWRAFRAAEPRLDEMRRVPDRIDLVAFNRVKNSRDTCLLWVSGLNSADMQRANAMSVNTPDRRRSLRLVAVDEPAARRWRGGDDRPLYRFEPISARFGSYDNLVDPARDPQTGASRPGTVEVPVVDAVIYAREEVLAALGERGPRLVQAVEDAGPAIWARVSPPVGQPPPPAVPGASALRAEAGTAAQQPMPATPVAATAPAPARGGAAAERAGGRVVARQGCNVRSDPKATAAVVRTIPRGTTLRVHGRDRDWMRIGEDEPWGWVHSSLLDDVS
jgi:hypothetical protein